MDLTFENIEKGNLLLYKYIRGSHAYGLNTETSDIDEGGIFIAPKEIINGLPERYISQISDERHDTVWYEVGRYLELLTKSNPTMLESLFVPDRCILYKHPIMDKIIEKRDIFITKDAVKSIFGYAKSQIEKARGLNKKIVNPITERKTPIDFCYTFINQGSEPITNFLDKRGLKQIYCGLNHVPNMNQMYDVFYDYPQHIRMEWKTADDFAADVIKYEGLDDTEYNEVTERVLPILGYIVSCGFDEYLTDILGFNLLVKIYNNLKPKGYHGIQKEDGSSTYVHLDSIVKGDVPICYMSYNDDGFQTHCRQYKEYQEWVNKRNPQRYLENKNKNFDRKNMTHCIRLITMAIEMLDGKGFLVDRTNIDREFLMSVRTGDATYDELMEYVNKLKDQLDDKLKVFSLPEHVNKEEVNNLLIEIRNNI